MGVFNKILFIKEDVGQKENLYLSMMDENHFSTNMLEHIKLDSLQRVIDSYNITIITC